MTEKWPFSVKSGFTPVKHIICAYFKKIFNKHVGKLKISTIFFGFYSMIKRSAIAPFGFKNLKSP